uniref:Uncharacterized protein n=1 Tax=Arundo donax TaxID=35708 RepID=A0A0A9CMY4_ARUDO
MVVGLTTPLLQMVPTGGTGWTTPLPERCLHPTS